MLSRLRAGIRRLRGRDAGKKPTAPVSAPSTTLIDLAMPLNGPPCPPGPIIKLTQCPVCGTKESTRVSRYNKFVTIERIPDSACAIYNYCVCHGCGVVYAASRPAGERYAWLMEHFEETIGRADLGGTHTGKLAISSHKLADESREHLRGLLSEGVFVSDHLGVLRRDFLPGLMGDRLSNSMHVEILGSLLPLHRSRVLEIRSRLGSISGALQRLYQADCHAMTLFENQQSSLRNSTEFPPRARSISKTSRFHSRDSST